MALLHKTMMNVDFGGLMLLVGGLAYFGVIFMSGSHCPTIMPSAFVCLSGQYFSLFLIFILFCATRNDGSQLGLGKQSVR